MPIVAGPPHFKFYAGTPITTKRGINIGSFFVFDHRPRPTLNEAQESLLGTITQLVMRHLEVAREARDRNKVMRMSIGLNAFVEGKGTIDFQRMHNIRYRDSWPLATSQRKSLEPIESVSEERRATSIVPSETRVDQRRSLPILGVPQNASIAKRRSAIVSRDSRADLVELVADPDESWRDSKPRSVDAADQGYRKTCSRAVNILAESLDLRTVQHRGGVLFLDASSRTGGLGESLKFDPSRSSDSESLKPAQIVACTATRDSFNSMDEGFLHQLLQRHPRGQIWSFDTDGELSSEEVSPTNELRNDPEFTATSPNWRRSEAKTLQEIFPTSRQLIFTGLWEITSSRWFWGAFAWTTSRQQVFSKDAELSFLKAFGNSVMAEVSRQASIAADRQKSDFISSISHEFRSPLHGILASAEFLSESETNAFQRSLVDTIVSCGRTLLDTINHILDYSKINSFERTWRASRNGSGKGLVSPSRIQAGKSDLVPAMVNISAPTNVAVVTEEVVEGVFAGQVYQDISSVEMRGLTKHKSVSSFHSQSCGDDGLLAGRSGSSKSVEVVLDIPHDNYMFVTEPGALRRIVMNVFGNALKYTQTGSIHVSLHLDPVSTEENAEQGSQSARLLEIKIKDTGKGISPEYLRTNLYTPFRQEDVLASGTGLGLSIVRAIVTMLNGKIDIESTVGKGTEVTVCLPMSAAQGSSSASRRPSVTSNPSLEDSIEALTKSHQGTTVAMYGFETSSVGVANVVKSYVSDWYGFQVLSGPLGEASDLAIMEEVNLQKFLQGETSSKSAIVLRSVGFSAPQKMAAAALKKIEFVSKPFGPYKLAKAIKACLERQRDEVPVDPPLLESKIKGQPERHGWSDGERIKHTDSGPVKVNTFGGVTQPLILTAEPKYQNFGSDSTQGKLRPRVLLVDDNKINLQLLQTFMQRRQYRNVDLAENGQFAVDAVCSHEQGYDIVFMDISMPVMNGFEATRAIRDLERRRKALHSHQSSAVVVALTGVASGADQQEAFISGVDLFMTKPVSFKEVGRLLDDWERERFLERETSRVCADLVQARIE